MEHCILAPGPQISSSTELNTNSTSVWILHSQHVSGDARELELSVSFRTPTILVRLLYASTAISHVSDSPIHIQPPQTSPARCYFLLTVTEAFLATSTQC